MQAGHDAARWMRITLVAAGAYNLVWGLLVVAFPAQWFDALGMAPPRYPAIWQCVGMVVGVYGVGYLIAASDPYRHWPIVLVGLLGKVLGPVGFLGAAASGQVAWALGLTILTNDLIWWLPFGLILAGAARRGRAAEGARGSTAAETVRSVVRDTRLEGGETLAALSRRSPVLLVFLRHLGCTFCRETLADVARRRRDIERAGTVIVLVHMGDDRRAAALFARYGLADVARVSDPERRLYRAFGLRRGRLGQLFGPRAWLRGVRATLRGNLLGPPDGDLRQMPGLVLLRRERVVRSFRHRSIADRPDYCAVAGTCEVDVAGPSGGRVEGRPVPLGAPPP